MERGSSDPRLRTPESWRDPQNVREERAWRSGITWPPASPFALVLARARKSDQLALSALYQRFLPVVYRFVLARVSDPHIAEDLTSDTFFAVVKDIAVTRATDELGFSAWVLGIARSRIAQHFRRQQLRTEAERELAPRGEPVTSDDEGDPLTIISSRESWSVVVEALNRLTDEQRAVVLYRCVLGYSAEEVADLLGKRPGTIRALQFRALNSLARHLGVEKKSARPGQANTDIPDENSSAQQKSHLGRTSDAD